MTIKSPSSVLPQTSQNLNADIDVLISQYSQALKDLEKEVFTQVKKIMAQEEKDKIAKIEKRLNI